MQVQLPQTVNKKVPHLRFSGFSEVWKRFTIQELIDKKYIIGHLDGNHGELYPRNEEFTKNGIPYIAASDIVDGKISLTRCKFLPLLRAKSFKKGIAKTGDVIFAHNATVGPTGILETNYEFAILSTTVTYFRCNSKELSNIFLKNLFTHDYFIHQYTRVMSQSTRNQVPITTQRKFLVNIPHIQEQQKIAFFLSSIDNWIENLKQQKSSLESYKKGIMQKIFSQEIRFKDSKGNEFPEWEEKHLSDVGEIIGGGTPDTTNSVNWNGEINWFTPTEIKAKYVSGSMRKISEAGLKNSSSRLLPIGTLLLTSRATIGDISISKKESTTNQGFQSIIVTKKNFNEFLYYWIKFNKKEFLRKANGSTFLEISGKEVRKIKISLPSYEEQLIIGEFLSSIDSMIALKEEQINQIGLWKKGLMQQLFV